MATKNPRHPHYCTIYRIVGGDSFSDGERVVLYEGVCRKEGSTSLRTFKTKDVIKADYYLSIPSIVKGVLSGDLVDVEDRQGTFLECVISDCYAGNLGTNVYFNLSKN